MAEEQRDSGPETTRIGRCACGALTVTCQGEPALVSLCHCHDCQRKSGGPFGIAAFFPRAAVTIEGESREYRRPSDSGHDVENHFCSTCGSTVYWFPHRMPDLVAVAPGTFNDPHFPKPAKAVYGQRRHDWVQLGLTES